MAEFPSWHILGAGSIGGLWAARLHQAGRAPVMVLRDQRFDDYKRAGGLTIENEGLVPVAAASPGTLQRPIDRLLVCCKSTQTLAALKSIATHVNEQTVIALVQNGMGLQDEVRQLFPSNTLLWGTTTNGAFRPRPFHIVPAGNGETPIGTLEGVVINIETADALANEVAALSCPGFEARYTAAIAPLLWRKLAINCAINPLTVRYQCRNGGLLEIPEARAELSGICHEIRALSRALNRMDGLDDLESTVLRVARQTAANHSSMLQDVRAGRETEIDFITGYLCRLATEHAVPTPLNHALYREVLNQK